MSRKDSYTYYAGIARQDITPPVGIRLIGYAVREGVSRDVDEPLTVTALAIKGQGSTVIIVGLDIVAVEPRIAQELRSAWGNAAGIEPKNILINASHTHSSPIAGNFMDYDSTEQLALQRNFKQLLLARGEDACRQAVASMKRSRVGVEWGECRGNVNRRQKDPDGNVLLGEDHDGVTDRSVGVIRVDDIDGKPIAVVFRYSCHTVTIGPKTNVISPDFVGPARALIESTIGCLSLFLQGCSGNSNPASGIGQLPDTDPGFAGEKYRLGHMLGGEVVKIAQNIRTHIERSEPRLVRSVAIYWLFENRAVLPGPEGAVTVNEVTLKLPLAKFPATSQVRQEREEWAKKLKDAQRDNEWELNPLLRMDYWAEGRLRATESGVNPVMVTFPVQVISIGEIKLVALPFEPMMETGIDLRQSLGGGPVFVLGYSNGTVSYLPTAKISAEGGMEAKLGYRAYLVPSEVPGDWEQAIKTRVLNLVQNRAQVD